MCAGSSILLPTSHVLKNFVVTPFYVKCVKNGSSLYFLYDLSLVSVTVILRVSWSRGEFGTSRILILFQEGRSFGFKLYFRMVVISSGKIYYFTLIKILSKFGSMLNLSPLSEMLCLQLGILF